jgi:hypothetical protein
MQVSGLSHGPPLQGIDFIYSALLSSQVTYKECGCSTHHLIEQAGTSAQRDRNLTPWKFRLSSFNLDTVALLY